MTIAKPTLKPTPSISEVRTPRLINLKLCQVQLLTYQLQQEANAAKPDADYPLTSDQCWELFNTVCRQLPDPLPPDKDRDIALKLDGVDTYLISLWRYYQEGQLATQLHNTDTKTESGHTTAKKLEALYANFTDMKIRLSLPRN